MTQPPLDPGITFTQPSRWVWHVSFHGERVGTVNGDGMLGFTARDVDHHSIGRGYVSAEAAMRAWSPQKTDWPAVGSHARVSEVNQRTPPTAAQASVATWAHGQRTAHFPVPPHRR